MKNIVIGILAAVDSGKTTLTEALLFSAGKIKKQGRVDMGSTYLDNFDVERERGITVFSKQAVFTTASCSITLLDTPGHIDFSAECERAVSVLDYAVLVVGGNDGVEPHTETLWKLLELYHVPAFIFVTKTDMDTFDKARVFADITSKLGGMCVDFTPSPYLDERIAVVDETVLDTFVRSGTISEGDIASLISRRRLFPCFFGSGLKLSGIGELIDAVDRYTVQKSYTDTLSAKVYKIDRDKSGTRMSFIKTDSGTLSTRQIIKYQSPDSDEIIEEKITEIRIYSGAKYQTVQSVGAGTICALCGLTKTYAGLAIGGGSSFISAQSKPYLFYRIDLPLDVDPRIAFQKLKTLEEEEPLLRFTWSERYGEIHAQIMGQMQSEIVSRTVSDRFNFDIAFSDARIIYKETIAKEVEGIGHFEPLRHYAEVHLILEPLAPNSGFVFASVADKDYLGESWQKLILGYLREKEHIGTLCGFPVTDMKITLISGRAHLVHTNGSDFREATYRAVRHGLMTALSDGGCVLLEPYCKFTLDTPSEFVGRAIYDIVSKHGTFSEHESSPTTSTLRGRLPLSAIGDYAKEVTSYTHSMGRFEYSPDGYYPCHNTSEVLAGNIYDPTADVENTPDSVFCSHGSGFIVPWNEVRGYMHLEAVDLSSESDEQKPTQVIKKNLNLDEKELEAIMEREFGPIKRPKYNPPKQFFMPDVNNSSYKKSLYIIDGYNVIFAWDELSAIARDDLEAARIHLCDILANYKAFTGRDIILVFDAYNIKGSVERKCDYHGLHIVYTKEDELGDTYIEKLINKIGKDFSVRVITSDAMIQLQAVRSGILRMSAREFRNEMTAVDTQISEILKRLKDS